MSSIIKNAAKLNINYTASSKTHSSSAGNVFVDDSTLFESSSNSANQWWEVSFSKIVAINSYTIKSYSDDNYRAFSWEAKASLDRINWEVVSVIEEKDITNNTDRFPTFHAVNCIYFRIVLKENHVINDNYLYFTFFDCFGGLGKNVTRKQQCFCNTFKSKNRLSLSTLLFSFIESN